MRRFSAALVALLWAVPASAQNFDFYVLALSWSPSFCAQNADRAKNQCASGANPGFVLHGLWPQFSQGFPKNCGGDGFIPYPVWKDLNDLYPDKGLARHEWRTHGTCSGLSAGNYFALVREAQARVKIPPFLVAPGAPLQTAPRKIERAFIDANPGLYPGMIAATCRGGVLTEARICLSSDLRQFIACPEVMRQACRSPEVTVPVAP